MKNGNSAPLRPLFAFVLIIVLIFYTSGNVATAKKSSSPNVNINAQEPMKIEMVAQKDRYWIDAKEKVYKSIAEIINQNQSDFNKGIKYHRFMHGDPSSKKIAITFDDGPHPKYTPLLLATLKKYKVKATFFLVGEMAEKSPDLVKAEVADGHSVGNHTFHHVNLTKIPEGYIATEIEACDNVLKSITGASPHLFRPPGGDYNKKVTEVSEALGYTVILWTDDPGDYASPGQKAIFNRTLDRIDNGGIILVHDGVQQTIDVLPKIIMKLRSRGYQFVTVDKLMKRK